MDRAALYSDRLPLLRELEATLLESAAECLDGVPNIDRISTRSKAIDRFLKKADSGAYAEPLLEIEDQVGLRVLVLFPSDLEPVRSRLRDWFVPVEDFLHRPDRDAEFGYLTHHFVFVIPDHLKPSGWEAQELMPEAFEAQVRTLFMHAYAEPNHRLDYERADDLPAEVRRQLAWIAASSWGADQALERVRSEVEPHE